ncbi:MAG: hypothetical protein PHI41_01870 [Erysipelotrichaceae bacterium]|nr:hypothetical protein [Erysipelotrichaceae bacterium]
MREKLMRFLYGRYGNDLFNSFLIGLALTLAIMNLFVNSSWLFYPSYGLMLYSLFRSFSRKYQNRRQELNWFLKISLPIREWLRMVGLQLKNRDFRYYRCKQCRQLTRVPKGRGKIAITCPRCGNKFSKRT